jgi:hypothetical protein
MIYYGEKDMRYNGKLPFIGFRPCYLYMMFLMTLMLFIINLPCFVYSKEEFVVSDKIVVASDVQKI